MLRLCAVLAIGLGGVLPGHTPDASIDAFIAREMTAAGVPGVAYAVVADGAISAAGAHGVVRAGSGVEVTLDTPFLTGSISKSITALTVMQLVESGLIALDEPFAHYLPEFPDQPARAITIRQLLSHTSGYSTYQGNLPHTDADAGTDELERRVDALTTVAPAYPPGDRWEYSNTNYQILGRLIEIASGQDYPSYIQAHILEPLGMTHSFVADGGTHEAMATGHTPWLWTKMPLGDTRTERSTAPQGGVIASAVDLALYLQAMMNGEDDVLTAAGKAQMMRPAGPVSPFYGFGWFIDHANGTVWHSGATPGNETLATMMNGENKGVVVLVNGGSGMGFGETAHLRNGITTRALSLAPTGEESRWFQQATFIALVLSPIVYLLSMVWAWVRRDNIRAKSGVAGAFSLWFPLLTTVIAAWVILSLVPRLLGSPIRTIALFQPDVGLALILTAVTGVAWAAFRLAVAYTGRSPQRGTIRAAADDHGPPETDTDPWSAGGEPREAISEAHPAGH